MVDQVLILAPRGRDAPVAADLLRRHGLRAEICESVAALLEQIERGAGAVLITEEVLADGERASLAGWIAAQPAWSDLPFIVLAIGGSAPRSPVVAARLQELGNVVLLQRPLMPRRYLAPPAPP